ncbi:MAG: GatB/YqeY domain-containing protein [Anaerolineales bacterium]|jgi:uncharacterized protein YqeY
MLNKDKFQEDLKTAMRSGDDVAKRTLRGVITAIKLAEVETQKELDERDIMAVLMKEVKSRRETIEEAEANDRPDLLASTQAEVDFLQTYLPEQMDEDEIRGLAQEIIREIDAHGQQAMGQVMKALMPKVSGRADGKLVSQVVQSLLANE